MRGKDVVDKLRQTLTFDEYESHRYEKTGYIRWESILHFYTIDCMKAGFLRKQKGIWTITEEGEKAMALGPEKFLYTATKLYREWDGKRKAADTIENDLGNGSEEDTIQLQKSLQSQYEEEAYNGIRDYICAKNPYEFQDLVAELLKAMGYYISEVAKRGGRTAASILSPTPIL